MRVEEMCVCRCRVARKRMGLFRFLVEGADGLMTVTTDAAAGVLLCLIPRSRWPAAAAVLRRLAADGVIDVVDWPAGDVPERAAGGPA